MCILFPRVHTWACKYACTAYTIISKWVIETQDIICSWVVLQKTEEMAPWTPSQPFCHNWSIGCLWLRGLAFQNLWFLSFWVFLRLFSCLKTPLSLRCVAQPSGFECCVRLQTSVCCYRGNRFSWTCKSTWTRFRTHDPPRHHSLGPRCLRAQSCWSTLRLIRTAWISLAHPLILDHYWQCFTIIYQLIFIVADHY